MNRSLQKVGNYPTLHSRASQALRVCRLRFTVQQCSGGLVIWNPSARPPSQKKSIRKNGSHSPLHFRLSFHARPGHRCFHS
jgi:hypothetical protein